MFSTLPGNGSMDLGVDMWGGFRDQIIGTAILMMVILAITDLRNTAPAANLAPFIVGLLVVGHRHGVGNQRRVRDQPGT